MKVKASYVEPTDYIPKELRKKFGVGEYNKDTAEKRQPQKKKAAATKKK